MLDEQLKQELADQLTASLKSQHRAAADIEKVQQAFEFAYLKHIKQRRRSGELYIVHPVAVAITLINLNADVSTICAGLLHDVLEDTDATDEDLKNIFGNTIHQLVDGVTKLGKLNFKSTKEEQANNFRKMLLAIAKDMRVVLVKLADRLNNMQTLEHLNEDRRKAVAQETLDIFAPLANRVGLHSVKIELEDLAFKFLCPQDYEQIKSLVNSKKAERESQIQSVQEKIKEVLRSNDIKAEIYGRAKHFYSIFKKLKESYGSDYAENGDLQIYDLLGVRVIVNDVKDCYASLGIIHETFRPIPTRFKDYIAVPKSNLYQSLHTTVITPFGSALEVQIRTQAMHDIAENGIAAHWHYKESGGSNQAAPKELEELTWIRQLLSWQSDVNDAQEYVETVKRDLLSQEVYILTPKGDVFTLPVDSTPIDFAYKVHTKIGDTCIGAKVNDKIVPINYKMQNGDVVEILSSKNAHPNLTWLNFVKTHQAKHKIKSWYKKQNKDRHLQIGREMLETEFGKEGFEQFFNSQELQEVAVKLNYKTTEDLVASIGSGDTSSAQIMGKLQNTKYGKQEDLSLEAVTKITSRKAPTRGEDADIPELDGLLYNIAKCCMPIPGEPVFGVVSKGKGITVHRTDCQNLKQIEAERLMRLVWGKRSNKTYPATINLVLVDRVGVVKDVLTLVADAGISIGDFKVKERQAENIALLRLVLNVRDLDELNKIMVSIKNMSDVLSSDRS